MSVRYDPYDYPFVSGILSEIIHTSSILCEVVLELCMLHKGCLHKEHKMKERRDYLSLSAEWCLLGCYAVWLL
jgi:hypothetical protein